MRACRYKHHFLHLIPGPVRVLGKDHGWESRGRGTETKQSQEHGVSGLHDAIWEMGMRVSLSSHL